MTNLTELEQNADREARHGHRELVKRLEEENRELALQVIASQGQADEALGRVAELEEQLSAWHAETWNHGYDTAWNDAIRAAEEIASYATLEEHQRDGGRIHFDDLQDFFCDRIRTLLRNEGGSDD